MFILGTILLGSFLFLYTLISMIRPLALCWWKKGLLCLPLGGVAFKFQLLYGIWGGRFFSPGVPQWVELVSNWLFMSLLMLVVVLLAVDGVRLIVWIIIGKRVAHWRSINNKINLLILLTTLVMSGWGIYQAFALPNVRAISIEIPQLQKAVRLAMLADLHADRYKQAPFFQEIVTRTNALHADAVVIVGDFKDGNLNDLAPALNPLRHLQSRWGTFAVNGNHDYSEGYEAWQQYLSNLDITFLNNEHVLPGDGIIALAGITDPMAKHNQTMHPKPNIAQAVAGIPSDIPIILLCHQPKLARQAALHKVALQLSGHTHGGHAPGLRQLIALFNDNLVQGLHRIGDTQVYVSNGTSLWSGFPLRLFTPSEITLIELLPEKSL